MNLFMRYGIKSVSMDDISRQVGISKKTLYERYENKSQLVLNSVEMHIEMEHQIVSKIIENSENAVQAIVEIIKFVIASIKSIKPTLTYDLQKYYPDAWALIEGGHFNNIKEIVRQNLIRGIDEGLYRNNINIGIQSQIYLNMLRTLVDERLFPPDRFEMSEVFGSFTTNLLYGWASDKGRELYNTIN